jgi:hypothetical protein
MASTLTKLVKAKEKFWDKTKWNGECLEWTGKPERDGYCRASVMNKRVVVHRQAWEFVYGPIPDGMLVCHKCDNRKCVRAEHLFLGTHQDNSSDMVSKNRQAVGTSHGMCKFTDEQIRAIRSDPRHHSEITEEYGVSRSAIFDIKNQRRRANVI